MVSHNHFDYAIIRLATCLSMIQFGEKCDEMEKAGWRYLLSLSVVVVCCLLSAVCCLLLSVVCCLLSAACCLLSVHDLAQREVRRDGGSRQETFTLSSRTRSSSHHYHHHHAPHHQTNILFKIKHFLVAAVTSACEELRDSAGLRKVLTMVLQFGNHMNANTKKGQAYGFKLEVIDLALFGVVWRSLASIDVIWRYQA
jgi:hypothetical protein